MNSTTVPGFAHSLAIISIIAGLLILTACGSGAGEKVASNGAQANMSSDNRDNAGAVSSTSPTMSGTTVPRSASPTVETQVRASRDNNNRGSMNLPSPQIGSGGSDFFLFTQARAALVADTELRTANITIEVKSGVLTLSGTIANATQKTKAEQLVRGVSGIKSVNNQLRISNRQLT